MNDNNPLIIQEPEWTPTVAPLILIHDGGGTVVQYYALGDLGRNVYGIFHAGSHVRATWKNGISTMAEEYCALIKDLKLPKGIIIGGWSLGGIIALEMSQILADDPDLDVLGVVLIESLYPGMVQQVDAYIDPHDLSLVGTPSKQVRDQIVESLTEGLGAVQSHHIPPGTQFPPTVLFQAMAVMPSLVEKGLAFPPGLGWDQDGHEFVKQIYNVPGHHYSIFDAPNAPELTAKLSEACTMIENGIWS